MNYLYIILICCVFSFKSNIIGTYSGQSLRSTTRALKNNGKLAKEKMNYNTHNLTLNKDSTFNYKFERSTYFSQISDVKLRNCSGKWILINDTLILNSNYKGSDFFIVKERINNSLPQKLIQISIRNLDRPYAWGRSTNLWINDKQIEECRNNDTVYSKCNEIKSIKLNVLPISFEYEFKPTNEEINEFEIIFRTELGKENYYLDNWKLLIDGNKLEPIDESNRLINGLKKQ